MEKKSFYFISFIIIVLQIILFLKMDSIDNKIETLQKTYESYIEIKETEKEEKDIETSFTPIVLLSEKIEPAIEKRLFYSEEECLTLDLTTSSNLTSEELSTGLKGKLKDYSDFFISAEKEYGINSIFLASLAAVESGWGEYPNKNNNLLGWFDKIEYLKPEDSILPTAEKFSNYYLNPEGIYYEGNTLMNVYIHYNGREQWCYKIAECMSLISNGILLTEN